MIIIGLIGRIGSGKSTVAQRFAVHGAHVIDADRIAHEVLDEGDVVRQIVDRFGVDVLDADGRIRRRAVADRVFGPTPDHARALEWLEALVHPRVRSRIEAQLTALQAREDGHDMVVVLDVPLLVQAGWADRCDRLVEVSCSEEIRRQRLAARHWGLAEQKAREAAWNRKYAAVGLPSEKMSTVDASGDLAYTSAQVDSIWSGLSG
ncbi:MAG: dephospho-CoA kinase [Planctomycetia bacterium]|nr:dephospho-CoA kinase [Planctomycetia bacterium]